MIAHRILGIDPGISGGIALYLPGAPATIITEDTPVVNNEVDVDTLVGLLREFAPTFAIIERVSAMPKQGVSSTFKFGTSYGAARAAVVALGIPYVLVTPTTWKRHFNLSSDGELSRALAIQLWPGAGCFKRKKDHNRAEAALLARYGAEVTLISGSATQAMGGGVARTGGGDPVAGPSPQQSTRATGLLA